MNYNKILTEGTHLFLGKIVTVAIGLINLLLLSRLLTVEEMGKYALFMMVINLGVQLGISWSDAAILRHGKEEFVKRNKINKSFWSRNYLFIPSLIFVILIYLIFSEQISEYIGLENKIIFFIISTFLVTTTLNYLTNIFRSTDKLKASSYLFAIQKSTYFIGLLLLMSGFFEKNIQNTILFLNLSFLLTLAINLYFFNWKIIKPKIFDKTYFKRIWNYSWPQLFGFFGIYLINYVDLFVIRKYLTLSDVGIYSIAYNGFTIVTDIILVLNTLFLPMLVEFRTKKQYTLIKKYISLIPVLISAWIVLVIIGLISSSFIITTLFSEKYAPAIPSFNILLIASIFQLISICFMPIINSFDLIIYNQIFNILKAILNIVLDFLLVPKYGIIGAAYGTLIAYAFGSGLTLLLYKLKIDLIHGKQK